MLSFADFAGVQTFRYRQSSLFPEGGLPPCIGAGANLSAIRTPSHFAAGWGAFHLRSPTGGAAKGMPLYTSSPSSETPCNTPPSTLTGPGCCATAMQLIKIANGKIILFIAIVYV